MPINIPVPGQETFNQRGVPDIQQVYMNGLMNYLKSNEARFAPQMSLADLERIRAATQAQQIQNQFAPQLSQMDLDKARAALQSQQIQNQFAPQQAQANLDLAKAHANYFNMGGGLSGTAKEAVGLEKIKQAFGEASPQYQTAKRAFDLKQTSQQILNENRQMLTESAPKRFSTNLGKTILEQQDIGSGYSPGTGPYSLGDVPLKSKRGEVVPGAPSDQDIETGNLSDESQKALQEAYKMNLYKKNTDPSLRKQAVYAANAHKTIQAIDPDALTTYAGINGQIQKARDAFVTSQGYSVPRFEKYQENARAADLLAHQIRQFYGDSIQPSMLEKIESFTNPSAIASNPQLAKKNYQAFIKILENETDTIREVLNAPSVFENPAGKSLQKKESLGENSDWDRKYSKEKWYGKYSQKDLEDTAALHKVDVNQVISDLRKKYGS